MLTTHLLLLPVTWLLCACQRVPLPEDTIHIGNVVFVRQSLEVGEQPAAVAAADLDRDGHLDLAVASAGRFVSIFRGDGDGGMRLLGRFPAGENPVDLALADIDRNGTIDIVAANHEVDYLTLLLGDGKGGFEAAPNSPLRVEARPHPHAVIANDLDGDGNVDLVVDHRAGHGLLLLRGTGGGAFEAPGTLIAVGGDPYRGMAVGDINRDGQPDLVTPNPRDVSVLLSASASRLEFLSALSVPAAAPFAVQLADIDGDGNLDVVAASDDGSSLVEIFLGDGRGGFRAAQGPPLRAGPGGKKIARGDFNGDDVHDVAVTSYQSPNVLVLLGGSPAIRTVSLPGGESPWGAVAADLNEDGYDDLVIVDADNPRITVYLSRSN